MLMMLKTELNNLMTLRIELSMLMTLRIMLSNQEILVQQKMFQGNRMKIRRCGKRTKRQRKKLSGKRSLGDLVMHRTYPFMTLPYHPIRTEKISFPSVPIPRIRTLPQTTEFPHLAVFTLRRSTRSGGSHPSVTKRLLPNLADGGIAIHRTISRASWAEKGRQNQLPLGLHHRQGAPSLCGGAVQLKTSRQPAGGPQILSPMAVPSSLVRSRGPGPCRPSRSPGHRSIRCNAPCRGVEAAAAALEGVGCSTAGKARRTSTRMLTTRTSGSARTVPPVPGTPPHAGEASAAAAAVAARCGRRCTRTCTSRRRRGCIRIGKRRVTRRGVQGGTSSPRWRMTSRRAHPLQHPLHLRPLTELAYDLLNATTTPPPSPQYTYPLSACHFPEIH
jgi:hypothetical protein